MRPVDVAMGRHYTSTPGEPTEHRPLREGEIAEWLSTLEVRLSCDEHTRLLETLRTLAAS